MFPISTPQAAAATLSEAQEDHQGTDWLLKSVPGTPGTDYPILAEVPETKFECNGQVEGGKDRKNVFRIFNSFCLSSTL
jgi:hypothetical protein